MTTNDNLIVAVTGASQGIGMGERPFREGPLELGNIIDVGLRYHHVATCYAAPLLIAAGRGRIGGGLRSGPSMRKRKRPASKAARLESNYRPDRPSGPLRSLA
jgi:hypothetical protein